MYFGYIFSLGAPIQLSFQKSSTSAGKPTLFKEGNILQPYNWQPSRPQIPYRTGINKISLFLFNGRKKAGKSGATLEARTRANNKLNRLHRVSRIRTQDSQPWIRHLYSKPAAKKKTKPNFKPTDTSRHIMTGQSWISNNSYYPILLTERVK